VTNAHDWTCALQGPITKAGNTYARKLLIEAAWQHRRPYARPGEWLLRQFDLVAPATRIRALEGSHRLHHEHFDERHNMSVKATTAIARGPAGWCWSLAAPLQQGERMNAA
jgi:transposase